MKDQTDLVRGWLRKARSDVIAIAALINADTLDTACFHAQQAAEKYLKAYLAHANTSFPYTHNLVKLIELCAAHDNAFAALISAVTPSFPTRSNCAMTPSSGLMRKQRGRHRRPRWMLSVSFSNVSQ